MGDRVHRRDAAEAEVAAAGGHEVTVDGHGGADRRAVDEAQRVAEVLHVGVAHGRASQRLVGLAEAGGELRVEIVAEGRGAGGAGRQRDEEERSHQKPRLARSTAMFW
jgi:hypothetical protein